MALDSSAIWGKDIADAIKAVGVTPGTPVDDAKLEAGWAAIKGEDRSQLTTKAATSSTGATAAHAAGAPATITALPGVIS